MGPAQMLEHSLATFGELGAPAYPLGGDAEASPLTGADIRSFAAACRARGLHSFGLYHWLGTIDWAAVKEVCGMAPKPVTVIGPDGKPLDCHAAVVDEDTWVDLGALLPALAGKPLDLRRDTPGGPSRCVLRQIAEAFGYTLDASAWPTVKITKRP
jgi:hypothetical protein